MICPHCQQSVKDGLQFCTSCGNRLTPRRDALAESFETSDPRAASSRDSSAGGGDDATIIEPDALLGRVLDAKYELTGRIGEGGMGAVYSARRIHIGDEVAVKVLHPKYLGDSAAVERFRREARAAAQLHHANVVTIHDYGETKSGNDDFAYIVMELVGGNSLRSLLKREKHLAPRRAVNLMRDICAGVGAAHRRGIVHRDIKPDNIIVLAPDEDHERETVKVVDFGIAKLRDMAADATTLTQTGAVVGTPYYMSPEQCRGDSLDARSDVYSLGALLYEMLSGAPPFTAATVTGVIAKHLTEQPPPLPAKMEIPRPLEAAVMRALSKDPAARQLDAAEFARELASGRDSGAGLASGAPAGLHTSSPPPPRTPAPAHVWPDPRPVAQTPAPHQQPAPPHDHARPAGTSTPAYFNQGTPSQVMTQRAPRRSRAPLIAGIIILLLFGAAGLVLVAYMLSDEQRNGTARETNRNTARNTAANANNANSANTNQRLNDAIAIAEAKILARAPLNEDDLKNLSREELRIVRNTVYARHGRVFSASDLQQHFRTRTWYSPRPGYSDEMLSEQDRKNLALIQGREGATEETATTDPSVVRGEVGDTLNNWVETTRAHDLDAHMRHYAATLDTFYLARGVSAERVRADRAKAFDRYARMNIELRNVAVTPDPSGAPRATVILDKHWRFEGEKCSEGTVKQMLWLAKNGGRWLITGEKDLYVYPDRDDDCD